jgi:superfamily II DNA or RNA helicase
MDFRIVGNRLYLKNAPPASVNWFKRRLTFTKEWGKKIEQTELFFTDETSGLLYTFAGLLKPLLERQRQTSQIRVIDPNEIEYKDYDVPNDLLADVTLLDFQVGAIKKALLLRKGIIQLPTGGGKTLVAFGLLRYLLDSGMIKKALILVPSVLLAEQFFSRALRSGFTRDEIGVIHGTQKQYGMQITVAVSNSVHRGIENNSTEIMSILNECDFFAADEFHHGRSDTWMKILTSCSNAKYVIGFTATPFHNSDVLRDAGDALVHGISGGPIFKISHSYLRNLVLPDGTKGLIALPVIHFVKISSGRKSSINMGWQKIYKKYVVDNKKRNEKSVKFIQLFKRFNFPVLILLQRKEHAHILMNMLKDNNAICVFGNQRGMQFDEFGMLQDIAIDYDQFTKDFKNGVYNVCFASQVFDEGFDAPTIGAVINAGAGRSRIKINQRTGRGLRAKRDQPNQVYIVDFNDQTHVFLSAQTAKRKEMYEEMEAQIEYDENRFWLIMKEHFDALQVKQ